MVIADLFHPVYDLAVERFLNGDMRHGRGWRGAMPMLLARRKRYHIAGMDLLNRAVLALHPTATGCDNESLAERMGMPRGAGTGLKGDAGAGRACRSVCLEQRIDPHRAGEPAGPLMGGCEPTRLISILVSCDCCEVAAPWARRIAGMASAVPVVFRKVRRERAMICEW